MRRLTTYLLALTIFCGCSLLNKMALKTTAQVIKDGSNEVLTEGNWEYFKASTPGNLKMLEGLWFSDQGNTDLLVLLIKGHAAYAFAVHETEALEDLLLENDQSVAKDQAILHYEKALFYGIKLLEESGVSESQFQSKDFSLKLKQVFDDKIEEENMVGVFYLAQALGSSINLQRDNVSKMSYLGHVREMLKWVCTKNPSIENGNCRLFQSVIEASTPTLLGGSQQKAKKMFSKVMKASPYNLMARLSYIQYHLIPMIEEEEYYQEINKLDREIAKWYRGIKDISLKKEPFKSHPEFNLFNAIAKERYKSLKKVSKEIF